MRLTALGVAAVLAIATVAPATAFEFDSSGGSTPGMATNLADPISDMYDKKGEADATEAPNGSKILQGLQLNISGGGTTSSSVNGGAMGWTNPQPGRLTR